jgi:hypothetical protein
MLRKRVSILVGLLASACATPAIVAQTTVPASTLPTTSPVSIDASTPKAAVRTFALALEAGDAEALRAVLLATDDAEREMADAMVRMAVAYASFARASVEHFGKAETDAALDKPDEKRAAAMQRVDTARETIEGTTATVGQEGEPPVVLKRVDGRWRIVIGAITPQAVSPEAMAQRVRGIGRQAAVLDEITTDVRSSRYRSMREVLTVLHGQMMKAAVESPTADDPTTAAATTLPAEGR